MAWRTSTEPCFRGKLKLWCMQYGLLPRQLWHLTLYEVPLSKVEKLERLVRSYVRKWLGLPRCLRSIGLYGKGMLHLPITSLVKEYKCAKEQSICNPSCPHLGHWKKVDPDGCN